MSQRSAAPWLLLAGLTLLISPLTALGVLAAQTRAHRERTLAALDDAVRGADARTHVRPVLRPPETDANAGAPLPWQPPPGWSGPHSSTPHLPPSPASRRADLALHQSDFEVLRAMTHGRTVASPIALASRRSPGSFRGGRAQDLLLQAALLSSPDACLQMTADAVRSTQDHTRGIGIVGLAVRTALYDHAVRTVHQCPPGATRAALTAAAAEYRALALSAPPPAESMRNETLLTCDEMLGLLDPPTHIPHTRDDLLGLTYLRQTLAVCDELLRDLPRWERLTPAASAPSLRAEVAAFEASVARLPDAMRPAPIFVARVSGHAAAVSHLEDAAAWLDARAAEAPLTAPAE